MIEYHVSEKGKLKTDIFTKVEDAKVKAFDIAVNSGLPVLFDVIVCSAEDAREHGGDEAVERYLADPDASVFERFEIKCNCIGGVA